MIYLTLSQILLSSQKKEKLDIKTSMREHRTIFSNHTATDAKASEQRDTMIRVILDRCRKFFSLKEIYLRELRNRWGRRHNIYRDRSDIARLYSLTQDHKAGKSVDDSTWNDLDMDALFDRLDNNTTPIGRQYLYRQLRTYEPDEATLQLQYQVSTHFKSDQTLRETVQLNMWLLRSSNASSITGMLFGEIPEGDFPNWQAWCLASISLASIITALVMPALFWLPIVPVIANFIFAEAHSHKIGSHSLSFVYLRNLLIVASRLSAIVFDSDIGQLEELKNNRQKIKQLCVYFRIVGLDSTSENPLVANIAYLLNLVCLLDFLIFMRCSKRLAVHKGELSDIYLAVASIDSAISVGSYMEMIGDHCCPVFGNPNTMHFEAVTHPLLEVAVPNDYSSAALSALITGSNMAGKSTFIKTIGTNLIMAQSIWICHARSALVPKAPVMSSIKRSDSLKEGKSYYFAEIEALLRLIIASDEEQPYVFLIDEILHGTNTVERIASAAAILDRISCNNIVLATSHDVELSRLLPSQYLSYHFQETADLENMFDYKLKEGHCTTRNAITLLQAIGFPSDVISAARKIASDLQS